MSRYIDADALKENMRGEFIDSVEERIAIREIDSTPSIDIVRCAECKYGEYREDFDEYECHCSGCGLVYDADFYCADGERREP